MRPCSLVLTAFGPFGDTQTVDFDALAGQGLFVIAGPNGAGKTSIFDGVYFALFGDLPGRRRGYKGVRSDHAPPDRMCRVEFEFMTGDGRRWRIERTPGQLRPKRRGGGFTDQKPQAVLYELTPGGAEPRASGAREVSTECTRLLALTPNQFERVALLPQGEFSRFLREGTTDRGPLLRTLFGTEIFERAAADLADRAKVEVGAETARRDEHQRRFESLRARVRDLTPDRATPDPQTDSGAEPGAVGPAVLGELGQDLDRFEREIVEPLAHRQGRARRRFQAAVQTHEDLARLAERFDRRDQLLARQAVVHAGSVAYEADRAALERARSVEPMAKTFEELDHQQGLVDARHRRINELDNRIIQAGSECGVQVASLGDPVEQRRRFQTVADSVAAIVAHRRQLDRIDTELTAARTDHHNHSDRDADLVERRANYSRRRQAIGDRLAELADLGDIGWAQATHDLAVENHRDRVRVRDLADRLDAGSDLLAKAEAASDELIIGIDAAQRAAHEQPLLDDRAREAADRLEVVEARRRDLAAYSKARARLDQVRSQLGQARHHADLALDAFLAGSAVRLAGELVDGQPCSVCGSVDHPEPATGERQPVTQAEVDKAIDERDRLGEQSSAVETELQVLHGRHPGIATWTVDGLERDRAQALTQATSSQTQADANRSVAASLAELDRTRQRQSDRINKLRSEIGASRDEYQRLVGSLGELASASIESLAAEVEVSAELVDRIKRAGPETDELRVEQTELAEMDEAAQADLIQTGKNLAGAQARIDELTRRRQLAGQEFATTHPDAAEISADDRKLDAMAEAAAAAIDAVDRLVTETAAEQAATETIRRLNAQLLDRIALSPFDSIGHARSELRSAIEIAELAARVRGFEDARADVAAKLDELSDLGTDRPDVDVARAEREQADQDRESVNTELARLRAELESQRAELASLTDAVGDADRAGAQARRLERVAALVNGTNDQRMSLENWVLAAYLRDVVDHANCRLADFTQNRFELCVVAEGDNRRSKWGLDLEIEDRVTGTRRPTQGLSGGELFCASLALALGLADVLMAQSGGVRLDAIFIDEGFGALDETSIDAAIDLLDGLREQGAMVGIVTHVPALLAALPVGVSVDKSGREGSRIAQMDGVHAA